MGTGAYLVTVILAVFILYLETVSAQNQCSTFPCQNGGTCLLTSSGFQCHCTSGWEGYDCSTNSEQKKTLLIAILVPILGVLLISIVCCCCVYCYRNSMGNGDSWLKPPWWSSSSRGFGHRPRRRFQPPPPVMFQPPPPVIAPPLPLAPPMAHYDYDRYDDYNYDDGNIIIYPSMPPPPPPPLPPVGWNAGAWRMRPADTYPEELYGGYGGGYGDYGGYGSYGGGHGDYGGYGGYGGGHGDYGGYGGYGMQRPQNIPTLFNREPLVITEIVEPQVTYDVLPVSRPLPMLRY